MNIRIDVKNLARWLAFLKEIPKIARPIALETFSRYMLEYLRNYPKYAVELPDLCASLGVRRVCRK